MNNSNKRLPTAAVVLSEQLRIAYTQLPTALALGILLAIATAWLLQESISTPLIALWLCLHIVVSFIRLYSLKHIASPLFNHKDAQQYSRRYTMTAIALGSVWAMTAFTLPYLPQESGIFILVLLLCIAGGALTSNASHFHSYLGYIVPIFLVLAGQLFIVGGQPWTVLGVLAVVYAMFMVLAGWKLHQGLQDSIIHRLSWQNIADELEDTRAGLDKELKEHKRTENNLKEVMAELEHAVENLQKLSTIDDLTGLANRRSFDTALAREWSRAQRNRGKIALLMIDVDLFKNFNDLYHHQSGDRALASVASVIGSYAKRPGDIAARYGGEEFALILSDADLQHVEAIAEKLRFQVAALEIEHKGSNVHDYLTVSVGVALVGSPKSDDYLSLISAADNALYQAKQEGRNRCCTAAPL